MKIFYDKLIVEDFGDGKHWILYENFQYYIIKYNYNIKILKGFKFDFASIPRILWTIIGSPATGKYRKATLIHDYLYKTHGIYRKFNKKQCDDIFYQIMLEDEVNSLKAFLMYTAVKNFGFNSWYKN